jgi:hypothetical protein
MTELERKAHRLVELARNGDDPTAAQLLSLHGAVAARIAAEGAIAASGTTATAKAASAGAFVKGLVAAAAIATGAAGYYVLQSGDAPPPAPVVQAPQPRVVPLPPVVPQPEPAAVSSVEVPAPPVKASKPGPGLRLEEEAALLAEVQGALRSGKAASQQARELRSPLPDRYAARRSRCRPGIRALRRRSRGQGARGGYALRAALPQLARGCARSSRLQVT